MKNLFLDTVYSECFLWGEKKLTFLLLQSGCWWNITGRFQGAVKHQEALWGDFLKWLQQISGGQEGAGLCPMADEQQEERVSVSFVFMLKKKSFCLNLSENSGRKI